VNDQPRAVYGDARLVVFDLDGTLVDSLRDLAESINELLIESGLDPLAHDHIGRMVGDGAATLVSRAFDAAGRMQPPGTLARFLELYNRRLLTCTRPYAGIPETLERLAASHALAVLTNKPLAATREILDGLGLARHFGAVLGGDGPLPRKPDPAGLLHLCETAHVTVRNTLLVGDSMVDWHTARAAGCRICLAAYGFGFQAFPVADLTPDERMIDAPADLLTLL
jgi:phosphoglycolate phosphatase